MVEEVCDDGTFEAQLYACGAELPTPTSNILCEAFVIEIPDSIFTGPDVTPEYVTGQTTSFSPGGFISINSVPFTRGIELSDPAGPWPTPAETGTLTCPSGSGEQCFPDFDGDNKPGMTAYTVPGGNYLDTGCGLDGLAPYEAAAAPLSADATALFGGAARADEVYVGFRLKGGGGGEIGEDCASGWGEGGFESMDIRAWGCQVLEGTVDFLGVPAGPNQPCTAAQAQFIDENLPDYTPLAKGETPPADLAIPASLYPNAQEPSLGSITSLVRLGDPDQEFTCDQVRAAAFPGPPPRDP